MIRIASKSFRINILTSKPLRLKILQTFFAEAAPVKGFKVVGRGVTLDSQKIPFRNPVRELLSSVLFENFFRADFHSRNYLEERRFSAA
jgi:hypothetical protein